MRVCLGGTFDRFHVGHELLLRQACKLGSHVFVGVTSDEMATANRDRRVRPLEQRIRSVNRFLSKNRLQATVTEITDPFGRSVEPQYDAIVVSPETAKRTRLINQARRRRRLKPLKVFTIPFVYSNDGLRLTATRVAAGDVDRQGRRKTPVRVAVGSSNRVKVDAVRGAFGDAFARLKLRVRGFDVSSGVSEQPHSEETWIGARNRAARALHEWPVADYGVGVEAGLLAEPAWKRRKDVQYVCVQDHQGAATYGHGGGFYYPRHVEEAVLEGRTISDVMGPLAGDPRIGSTKGAVGYLTKGSLTRRALTRHGVLLALVPRIRRDWYQE